MYFVILIESIADKRAVHMTLISCYLCIRRNNDTSGRSTYSSCIASQIPYNICAAAVERSAVDVAEIEVVASESGSVNVDNNINATVVSENLYKVVLEVLV